MTSREQTIHTWLSGLLPNVDLSKLQNIQSDASQRKYSRLQTTAGSFVIMDTKPDQEIINFSQLAKILIIHKITVPEIIHCNAELGLILMSDLGAKTYLDELRSASNDRIDSLYLDAITTLIKIQQISTDPSVGYHFKVMNDEYLKVRLEIFSDWYLQKHLGVPFDANIQEIIAKLQKLFSTAFAELPHALVHVDYHCRNLMVLPANNPGVLDFQDAMLGPITYDLASLFQDAYITWPRAQIESWILAYKDFAVAAGIMQPVANAILIRNFDLVGLQRHIKNLGIFARLHHRDQKSNYLNDIPTLLNYIHETCARYKELDWLLHSKPFKFRLGAEELATGVYK